jgi:hypothetical protein
MQHTAPALQFASGHSVPHFSIQKHSSVSPLVPSSYHQGPKAQPESIDFVSYQEIPDQKVPPPVQSTDVTIAFGWNRRIAKPAPRPLFFSDGMIKAELPNSEFEGVLERLESFFKYQSIQATFCDSPPSVKLQTVDLVEFCIKFWEAPYDQFCVDIQRHRGDCYKFHDIMLRVVDVITGVDQSPNRAQSLTPMSYEQLQHMLSFVQRLAPTGSMDSNSHTERIIHSTHALLTSPCFMQRASGLESLMHATDMRHNISLHAREAALICLAGEAPTAQIREDQGILNQKCRTIQGILLQVLIKREFQGDDSWKEAVANSTFHPFMSSQAESQCHYEHTMMYSIHKVLTILSNSLEVFSVDGVDSPRNRDVLSSFLSRCSQVASKDLISTLASLMDGCHICMAVAYLACRVLRLFAAVYPPLKTELRTDSQLRACVDKACQAGRTCHSLLETESQLLRDGIMT